MRQLKDYLYIVNFRQRAASSFSCIFIRYIREDIAINFAGIFLRCPFLSQCSTKYKYSVLYCSDFFFLIEFSWKQLWQHLNNSTKNFNLAYLRATKRVLQKWRETAHTQVHPLYFMKTLKCLNVSLLQHPSSQSIRKSPPKVYSLVFIPLILPLFFPDEMLGFLRGIWMF